MKRGIIILALVVLLGSFVSADIIFTQQVKPVYNLGDTVFIPITIKTVTDVSGIFQMNLLCNGTYIPFYMNGVDLAAGAEKSFDSSLVLIRNLIGDSKGTCKIKAVLGGEYALSSTFRISDILDVQASLQKTQFDAGETISITGKVIKETGENSNGFIDARIITSNVNQNINQQGTINEGTFYINLSLPNNIKAGNYFVSVRASERNTDGITTNIGFFEQNISVRQVPTNLELLIENKEIMPGNSLNVKAILHDQTGENIDSTAIITIKDSADKILEQKEVKTNEFIEYQIKSNEPPAQWKVLAISNELTAENNFFIKVKENVDIKVANKTIFVTNTGNVVYNKTIFVKVGDSSVNIPVKLETGESKKYYLSAPDGEYNVEVSGGEQEISEIMSLTGNAIDVREISTGTFGILLWIFLILISGIAGFIIFRKIYKKPFFGHTTQKINKDNNQNKQMPIIGSSITSTGNKAEISLSIKGEKQDASVICLRIKDLREMKGRRGSPSERIQRIIELAQENKAVVYENQDYLFFILAPTKTRTFKNEVNALNLAEKIENLLSEHNKMFNQKMDFGISLNYGTIVAKMENGVFKFMSMGTMITAAKKIAGFSKGEVLLSDKMNDLLRLNIRTDKQVRDGVSVFSVKEVKRENEEAKKFIDRFLNRQEKQ